MSFFNTFYCRLCIYALSSIQSLSFSQKRVAEYPKGSELFLLVKSNHSKRDETRLLYLFNIKFEKRIDEGNEYFIGDPYEMIELILNEIVKKR